MRKLLLVIDEFSELMALESLFRRLGFDVMSLGKEVLVNDALLRFSPDIAILSCKGKAVDGLKLSLRVKKCTPPPRVALLHAQGVVPELGAHHRRAIDAMIESPLRVKQVIGVIGQLGGLDVNQLLEKYEKIGGAKLTKTDELIHVTDNRPIEPQQGEEFDPKKTPGVSPRLRTERSNRYDSFLSDHAEPVDNVVSREALKNAMAKLDKNIEANKSEKAVIADLDEERQAFAKALFEQADQKSKQRK